MCTYQVRPFVLTATHCYSTVSQCNTNKHRVICVLDYNETRCSEQSPRQSCHMCRQAFINVVFWKVLTRRTEHVIRSWYSKVLYTRPAVYLVLCHYINTIIIIKNANFHVLLRLSLSLWIRAWVIGQHPVFRCGTLRVATVRQKDAQECERRFRKEQNPGTETGSTDGLQEEGACWETWQPLAKTFSAP